VRIVKQWNKFAGSFWNPNHQPILRINYTNSSQNRIGITDHTLAQTDGLVIFCNSFKGLFFCDSDEGKDLLRRSFQRHLILIGNFRYPVQDVKNLILGFFFHLGRKIIF